MAGGKGPSITKAKSKKTPKRKRDHSPLDDPCPARRRSARQSTSSKKVIYDGRYHPIDEATRPNRARTIRHQYGIESQKQDSQVVVSSDSSEPGPGESQHSHSSQSRSPPYYQATSTSRGQSCQIQDVTGSPELGNAGSSRNLSSQHSVPVGQSSSYNSLDCESTDTDRDGGSLKLHSYFQLSRALPKGIERSSQRSGGYLQLSRSASRGTSGEGLGELVFDTTACTQALPIARVKMWTGLNIEEYSKLYAEAWRHLVKLERFEEKIERFIVDYERAWEDAASSIQCSHQATDTADNIIEAFRDGRLYGPMNSENDYTRTKPSKNKTQCQGNIPEPAFCSIKAPPSLSCSSRLATLMTQNTSNKRNQQARLSDSGVQSFQIHDKTLVSPSSRRETVRPSDLELGGSSARCPRTRSLNKNGADEVATDEEIDPKALMEETQETEEEGDDHRESGWSTHATNGYTALTDDAFL